MQPSDVQARSLTVAVPAAPAGSPDGAAAGDQARARERSIVDFLTDGSLVALCDELSRLAGVRVTLLDAAGRRVGRASGEGKWTGIGPAGEAAVVVPLSMDGRVIGSLAVGEGHPRLGGDARGVLERAVGLLASTAAEFCGQQVELEHRVKEVGALYRLSSMLARATRLESVLQIALESALDVLELDAGSIVLFDDEVGPHGEGEEDLALKASRNLSEAWLKSPLPLSKGRVFDRLALGGEVVVSENLRADERVLIKEEVAREGLWAALHAGLVFQDKPIGVIRLYARRRRGFTEADVRLLKSVAHQAAVAVQQARLLKVQEHEAQMQRQLELAGDVQRRMLPRRVPSVGGLDVAARYVPSHDVGGDFYDLFEVGPNLGMVIGDVVGKGVAAALLMSAVRATLRAHVQDVYHMDEVMARVNRAMCRDTEAHEFVTLWYGVLDPRGGRLTYCSAGHEPPWVVRRAGRRAGAWEVRELPPGGLPVGIDPSQPYQSGTMDLRPGDVVVAYTDGVTDAFDFEGRKFGKARLRRAVLELLGEEPEAAAARVVERIFWELRQFAGLQVRGDDQTLCVLRVRG